MKKLHLLTLLACLALPLVSKAQQESFNYTIPAADLSLEDDFSLPAFNPDLGTLTGVTITLNLDATAVVEGFNISGGAATFAGAISFPATLTGPDGTSTTATTSSGVLSGPANTTQYSITPLLGPEVEQTVNSAVPAGNFSLYEGLSTVNFNLIAEGFSLTGGTTLSGPATIGVGGGGSVQGGTATVTYTFTAAPEPSTWAMLLGGVGLLAFWRAKARRA